MPSQTTLRANALVADRLPDAEALGRALAEDVQDPTAFAAALRAGLARLADPDYLAGQHRVAPGIGALHGVRRPLLDAIARGFRAETLSDPTSGWLFVVDRLLREPELEARWFAFGLLERLVLEDPERSWQLIRRAARDATDWITVDSLARPVARGVLREPYRWAELELLVFSPSRWERRLVASTIASAPHVDPRDGRDPAFATRALGLVASLIGDAEPDVQKALSWALRTLVAVDREATTTLIEREAERAAADDDGHRAWVVRDSLSKLDDETASRLRASLAGVRRRTGHPSTSVASAAAAGFADVLGTPMPEPPLS